MPVPNPRNSRRHHLPGPGEMQRERMLLDSVANWLADIGRCYAQLYIINQQQF